MADCGAHSYAVLSGRAEAARLLHETGAVRALPADLDSLCLSEAHADAHLKVGAQLVPLHMAVLSARLGPALAPLLAAYISEQAQSPLGTPMYTLRGMSADVATALLRYLYR